ncbi:MAG: hypothetical protein ACON4H_10100 [Rubripirellula sp.]
MAKIIQPTIHAAPKDSWNFRFRNTRLSFGLLAVTQATRAYRDLERLATFSPV